MHRAGILLLVAGTVVASLGGARLPEADRLVAGLGLAMLGLAVVLLRRSAAASGGSGMMIAGSGAIVERLRELLPRVEKLAGEIDQLSLQAFIDQLSALETRHIRPLSELMPALLDELGAARFAEVAGTYASGERLLSRAWSAAADRHRPEATMAIRDGASRLRQALEALDDRAA